MFDILLSFLIPICYVLFFLLAAFAMLCLWPAAQRFLIYLNFFNLPFIDLEKPEEPRRSCLRRCSYPGLPRARVIRTQRRNLLGWHVPAQNPSGISVLYFHGNGANVALDHRVELYNLLNEMGIDVYTFDYTGFGANAGSPTQEELRQDARDMFDTTVELTDNMFVIWGHSLGSGVLFQLLQDLSSDDFQKIDRIVLESAFTAISNVAYEAYFPSLIKCFMSKHTMRKLLVDNFNSLKIAYGLKSLPFPVDMFHEKHDPVIPFQHGELLEAILSNITRVRLHEMPGWSHHLICRIPEFKTILYNEVFQLSDGETGI